jgi:CheY-like chemotaxis protein
MMKRQLTQLVRLVDDLLEVSRISTGRTHLRLEHLDLVDAVRSAFETVEGAAQERTQSIDVAWPNAAIWVEGDRTRLAQIFVNLLSNAVRYTEPGGHIAVRFATAADSIEVQVEDDGIGIDPEMQAQVFGLFVQVDKSMGRGRAGLGVGLSLARELAQLHGGTISLRSPGLGKGSTFTVCLPLAKQAPPVAAAAPLPVAVAAIPGQVRVLIADDNHADSLAEVMRMLGCDVCLSYDGNSALAATKTWAPDVCLFDIGMPGLDGYELAAAVRQLPGGDRAVLVAVTGWGQQQDQQRAKAAGFDQHFVKPVDVEKITALLAARQAAAAAVGEPRLEAPH